MTNAFATNNKRCFRNRRCPQPMNDPTVSFGGFSVCGATTVTTLVTLVRTRRPGDLFLALFLLFAPFLSSCVQLPSVTRHLPVPSPHKYTTREAAIRSAIGPRGVYNIRSAIVPLG
eukprot:521650-Prorocentrum_minimum.AAC.1